MASKIKPKVWRKDFRAEMDVMLDALKRWANVASENAEIDSFLVAKADNNLGGQFLRTGEGNVGVMVDAAEEVEIAGADVGIGVEADVGVAWGRNGDAKLQQGAFIVMGAKLKGTEWPPEIGVVLGGRGASDPIVSEGDAE